MSRRDPTVPLRQMRDHARTAIRILGEKERSAVEADEVLLLALCRLLEILGEAAGRVPESVRGRHPGVPWRSIIGLRNVLIHGYDTIDLDVLWKILSDDLPALVPALEAALREEQP